MRRSPEFNPQWGLGADIESVTSCLVASGRTGLVKSLEANTLERLSIARIKEQPAIIQAAGLGLGHFPGILIR